MRIFAQAALYCAGALTLGSGQPQATEAVRMILRRELATVGEAKEMLMVRYR